MAKDKSLGADGKPKYFFTQEKAQAFIDKKKLGDTHKAELVETDELRAWLILPKE